MIFYSDAAHRANAEALGALLNITKLVETADFAGTPLPWCWAPDSSDRSGYA